jgi:hypothetical protein
MVAYNAYKIQEEVLFFQNKVYIYVLVFLYQINMTMEVVVLSAKIINILRIRLVKIVIQNV